MDTYTKTMVTIVTVCVVVITLLLVGSSIFEEHDYGYVEELYENLEYISHRIDELEERLEE